MPEQKSFGDGQGLLTIIGIIIGLGVAFMLFACVYKFLTDGGPERIYSFRAPKPPANSVSPEPPQHPYQQPHHNHGASDSASNTSTASDANFSASNPQPDPPQLNLRESIPNRRGMVTVIGEEDEFKVDAVIISNRTKVPKHGREIITPRATVVPIVDAHPYESDMESQAGSTRSDRPIVPVVLDHRAPAWYNDD